LVKGNVTSGPAQSCLLNIIYYIHRVATHIAKVVLGCICDHNFGEGR